MEAYAKVSVSELSQNLVPTSDTSENKRARTSTDCPPVHFYLSRTVGNDEFKSQIQTIWLQGHVISTSADKTVLEIAEEPSSGNGKQMNFDTVIVTGCDKVPGGSQGHFKGHYCQILGEVTGIDTKGKVRIRAIKIVDLNHEEVLKQVWPFEVEDYKRVIFNLKAAQQ